MTNNSYPMDEYGRLLKILNFRLPHRFKQIGLFGAIAIFFFLLVSKFIGHDSILVKDVLRTCILLFMLLASLSKDILEDEYNRHVRFQSFVLAVIVATVYSISIPLIAVIFDALITKITGDGNISFYEISAFEVLFILLGIQLLFFETLKRYGRV